MTEKEREMAAMAESSGPEYGCDGGGGGVIGPSPPARPTDCQLLPPQQHHHQRHQTDNDLQANGPDKPTKPIKTESSSGFLRAARAGNLEKLLEYLKGKMDINTSNANGLNALHLAAKEGHMHVVKELLARGASVDAATKKGNSALHIASLAGQADVVEVLVENGAKVNVQSQNGFTPLYMAAQENHSEVVKFLLSSGANQSLSTEDGFTPLAVALQQGHDRVVAVLLENDSRGKVHLPALHIAAKKDDVKATTLLLQNEHNFDTNKNGGLVNDTTKSGFTPLHIACHYGNANVGRLLIEKGADVNYKARNSITPLHVASKWGRSNMVELLLDAKALIDSRTRDGLTPLHCAARSGHDSVVDLLLERGALVTCKTKNGLTPLHMSSQGDHLDCARLLLYHKAPIDEVTVDYLTPLHVVAHCGNVKTAKLLLDRKCEVNARALNGFTPLHIACKKNRIKIVELLLKYGASLEATTESGLTPLHVSSFMGHMNIVIFLIQHGSNPNHTTMRGETALHLAARANQTDIVRILLRNGAQVDHAKTREQQTALHISSRLGNVDNVLLLLQHGASPDATTKDLYTPLHIAAKEGHDEVVQVLLEHGAKQALTTKRGFTPLHVASKYGNLKVVQSLIQRGTNPNFEGKNSLTPLHVATHYNRVNVALYLLDKNASPHCSTKNGYTSLHIAAKKNQMDIATTLLEHGSNVDAESRNGFTPLHLASQEGHTDMVALLSERGADANCAAKNGLTPLHLTAQEDHVSVAQVLVGHKAKIDPQTKAGYTPLHTACHFGQVAMIRFLLEHDAAVNSTTKLGYTPLHQAAQQGHVLVNSLLLKYGASPNVVTNTGQTPLSIAQRLGYISVVEILKNVTNVSVSPSVMEEKYKVTFPETMQEAPISDSEEEGGEESLLIDQSFHYLTSSEKPSDEIGITKDNKDDFIFERASDRGSTGSSGIFIDERKSFKESGIVPSDFKGIKEDAMIMSFSECSQSSVKMETMQSEVVPYQYSSQEIPSSKVNQYDEGDYFQYTSSFSGVSNAQSYETSVDFSSEHSTPYSGFLVSFMVDARGGAMRGCRHSGVRVIVPPGRACMPTRVTCRLVKREKVVHPPALMEGEALASRILEMGPVGTKFSGPVIIEIPHFASLRGKEREITVLRSENGQTWREHSVVTTEEAVQEALRGTFFSDLESSDDLLHKRIIRILTTDIPQYFAIVARVRQETSTIGPDGGMICSTVTPCVQALFPEGSLTKNIKVGLQVLPVPSEAVSKLLGNRVAVSPIVTVEPRRRKFHRPITLTIPAPTAAQKGMLNQYGGETPTLRLLCSIMGGTSPAQWEDITGTTPLTFVNDCVSFTTTVSARFWLMDCQNVNDSAKMASDLYHDIILVPFMSRFVVFAKRHDPMEARLHVFCMTDDKMDKHLENREHFQQVARSSDVEVLEAKPQYVEMGGNLVPVTKSGEKPCVGFRAFRENRLAFTARVRDVNHDASGLLAFMREPKISRSEVIQVPICTLTITLPDYEPTESPAELEELKMQYRSIKKRPAEDQISKAELWLTDIADSLGPDWIKLAHKMEIDNSDISKIEEQYTDDSEKALLVLHLWIQRFGERATGNELEKALNSIGREDVVQKCLYNIEEVTDAVEKVVAKVYLDSSGFDALRDDLGSSVESSIPLGAVSLDASYEEQDIIKESESLADESITLEGNNIELTSLEDGETAPALDSFDEQNVKEVTTKTEDLSFNDTNIHLSHFEMHRFPGEDSNGIVDISDTGFQSSVNELELTLTKEEAKQTFAADILDSSFADVSRGILQWELKSEEFDDNVQSSPTKNYGHVTTESQRPAAKVTAAVFQDMFKNEKYLDNRNHGDELDEFFRFRLYDGFHRKHYLTHIDSNKIDDFRYLEFDQDFPKQFEKEQDLFFNKSTVVFAILPKEAVDGKKQFKVLDKFLLDSHWNRDGVSHSLDIDLQKTLSPDKINQKQSYNFITRYCHQFAVDLDACAEGEQLCSCSKFTYKDLFVKDALFERKVWGKDQRDQYSKRVPDNVNPEKKESSDENSSRGKDDKTDSAGGQEGGDKGIEESNNSGGSQNPNNGNTSDGGSGDGKNPPTSHSSIDAGEIQCRIEESEDQSVLSDGTVVKRKIVKRTFWREIRVVPTDDSEISSPAVMEEIVRIEIDEDVKEIPPDISNPSDENVDSETTVELSEHQMSNGANVKRTVTKTRFWLKHPNKEEVALTAGTEAVVTSDRGILLDVASDSSGTVTSANVLSGESVMANSSETIDTLPQDEGNICLPNVTKQDETKSDAPNIDKDKQTSEVTEDDSVKADGTRVKLRTITKRFYKDLSGIEEIEKMEIEEQITELAPGVAEPFGDDVELEKTSDCNVYQSPGDIPTKKVTTKVIARFKNSNAAASQRSLLHDSEIVKKSIATEDSDIKSRTDVSEDKTIQGDGTTMKKKLVTKTFYREGNSTESTDGKSPEEVVKVEVEEHIVELPAGVSDSLADDADTETTTESSVYQLTDGTPVQRTLTKVIIHKQLEVESRTDNIVVAEEDEKEVKVKTEVTENENVLNDGTTVKTKMTTKLFVKEISSPDGKPEEKVIRTEIEELVTELAAGIIEPCGNSVNTETTQESSEFLLPDGSPAIKTVKRVTVRPNSLPDRTDVNENGPVHLADIPNILTAAGEEIGQLHVMSEGDSSGDGVEVRTEVTEDENVLVDGTVIKKQVTTRTAVRSATRKGSSAEEIVETEIEERIVQLAPGITDPFGDNVETESSTESFRYYLDNGSPVVKTVVMIIAHFPLSGGLAYPNNAQILLTGKMNDLNTSNASTAGSFDCEDFGAKLTNGSVVNGFGPMAHPDVAKLVAINTSVKKGTLFKKIRNVAPDGSITEDACAYDDDGVSDTSSVSDIRDLSPFAFSSTIDDLVLDEYDPDSLAIQVCTSTDDADPTVENDVKEFEDVLPDGTIVRRTVTKTTERKTFVNHVVIHVPHTSRPVNGDLALENYVEPYLAKYSHMCRGVPEVTTNTQMIDDIGPDGTPSKKRVSRKVEQQLSMERTLLIGNMPSLCGQDESSKIIVTSARTNIPAQYVQSRGDGSQQTALVPSNQELSRADDEQVSRVILRKQIHKKTIVQGVDEETIITEDTQIQQDDNAPQELKDSVQELISQFLDSNGDQGSTDDLAE